MFSARKYPDEAVEPLVSDMLASYFELQEVPPSLQESMNSLVLEGLTKVPGLISLTLGIYDARVLLKLVGSGGSVVELELGGPMAEEDETRAC